jgi:molybdopterin-guanine dinucleotide biosynthesis protein A
VRGGLTSLGRRPPVGVVLAGGKGRRIGGSKALVELCGRPLIAYPLRALGGCLNDVAVLAKAGTALPALPGATVWIEPDEPSHPLAGIAHALALAGGRAVIACAADMPFVTPALIQRLMQTPPNGAPAVIALCEGRLQPFPGLYLPPAAEALAAAAGRDGARLTDELRALDPRLIEVDEPEAFFNVNAPEDVLHAAAILDRRSYPNVKS